MSVSQANIGNVIVHTADYRGATPEELADRALNRIIYVGDTSHPVIIEQARIFKEQIRHVLEFYLREAQSAERVTICGKLALQGREDLSELIKNI